MVVVAIGANGSHTCQKREVQSDVDVLELTRVICLALAPIKRQSSAT